MAPIGDKKISAPSTAKKPSTIKKSSSKSTPAKAAKPANKGPQDSARVSADAKKADKPNAMAEGITKNWKSQGLETSEGNKLGKYTKGGEGTIEKELLKKGFSLKDIYTKDKQGRTLADQVAQTNGIKNQKQIADGKELKLPQRPGAQGVSSGELKPGEAKTVEAVNGANQAQQTITKGKDESLKVDQSTAAGTNRANVTTETGPGGTSTGSVARQGNEVVNNNLTQSANNKAITETQQRTNNGDVQTSVRDADGVPNSTASLQGNQLQVSNPDGQGGGVKNTVGLGPQSISESIGNLGDRVGSYVAPSIFKPQQITGPEGPVNGVSQVSGTQKPDGSARYDIRQGNGQVQSVDQTARGPLQNFGKGVSDTLDSIGSGISSGFNRLFGGSNPNGGIPAEQIFSPSGTII